MIFFAATIPSDGLKIARCGTATGEFRKGRLCARNAEKAKHQGNTAGHATRQLPSSYILAMQALGTLTTPVTLVAWEVEEEAFGVVALASCSALLLAAG
jgi:hypothetical protein